jgi:hypothetical protein
MRTRLLPAVSLASLLVAAPAAAATLTVGAGQMYATPCAAIAAAQPSDEIDISAGTYNDSCNINTAGLHLKGVGGRPKIDITGNPPSNEKGIYAIGADDVIIENLELAGAAISSGDGENGAGLRIQSNGVIVTNCYIHDNQNGILAGPTTGDFTGTLTVDHSEFSHNGLGMGCFDGNGCTHNLYIGKYQHLIFQFNYSHDIGEDTGHLLKSRAAQSDILYNRITGENGMESYAIDLPQAGNVLLIGNLIEKSAGSQNSGSVVLYGDSGDGGPGPGPNTLYAVNNTFVNNLAASPKFINVGATGPTIAAAHNNVFVGMGTPSSTGALPADNLVGMLADFVAPATYDYHLVAGAPEIGKAVPPGTAGSFPLTPVFEYVDPVSAVARLTDNDVGAFEHGTNTSDPSMDAGAESPDGSVTMGTGGSATTSSSGGTAGGGTGAGSTTSSSSGSGTGGSGEGGSGAGGSGTTGSKSGCSYDVTGDVSGAPALLALALGWLSGRRRSRRRARG